MKINFLNILRTVCNYKDWDFYRDKVVHKSFAIFYYRSTVNFPFVIYSEDQTSIYDTSFVSWCLLSFLSYFFGSNPFKENTTKLKYFPIRNNDES